ncbi:microcystin degradation protein MlrC [Sphingobacterium sp. DK4209]|uniref:Microcystin degradation protein MlrC n=1 Tax=Sphingobacterium zhuxiongii TaxID=2662364 RepID=A0A5Q0QDN5_9SPHI|nr:MULTISPECIES: M81 family metallopeptidase [unclassified Sphingobacterium]MVZ64704.1 microcystin degradation protein MlrC [Sphingobacterium sp. DK4209]QGA27041.1 microcystin degradation protein MlrC [Sphingobacterium sp. dk4302]
MKKRIAIAGIYHESNTFSSIPTEWENFTNGHIFRGQEIIERFEHAHHEIAGFLQEIQAEEIEVVPLFVADAIPSGTIKKEVALGLANELCDAVQSALPLDGIYCVAHGAAAAEEIRDVDGYWMTALRAIVGANVPMMASLDPHANVSNKMIAATDAMISYTTNPHLDQREIGQKIARLMKGVVLDDLSIKQELLMLPASLSLEQQETSVEPCLSMYKKIADLTRNLPILSHSIILGFPYADVEEMGTSLILVSENQFDTTALKQQALAVFESYYPQFTGKRLHIQEVIDNEDSYAKPVLLLDMGDNVGAGALGNSSYLLKALEANRSTHGIIVIYDPQKVQELKDLDIESWTEIILDDQTAGDSIQNYKVQILEVRDGSFSELTPRHGGQTSYDMGRIVLVKTELCNYILFTSLRVPPFSSQQIEILNLDLSKLNWIVAKGVNAPIAAYRPICPVYLKIQTPGESNADATQYQYKYRRRPMLPFEALNVKYDG